MGDARRVLIGITGGIAAYKIPPLVRLLRKNGCEVKTVLTRRAQTLVGVDALRTLSGNPVFMDEDKQLNSCSTVGRNPYDMDHIRLSEWADIFLIAPATANTLAKIACGIADNLLTTLALSIDAGRVIAAPAMNCVMWKNKATQTNINTLKGRGVTVLDVEEGELACGVSGPGRMCSVEKIFERVMAWESQSPAMPPLLEGKRVLISSGPTEEPIDPVRVITNRSSGRMGAELARTALMMGARVTVVSGPAAVPPPDGAEVVPVKTAGEMEREMADRFKEADICIMAAAVSDYRPANPSGTKIRKTGGENITIELTPNPDILAGLGAAKRPNQFLAGFALEDKGADIVRAYEKMTKKNCDMMVFNKAGVSLGGGKTEISLLFADGERREYPETDKSVAAMEILNQISTEISKKKR